MTATTPLARIAALARRGRSRLTDRSARPVGLHTYVSSSQPIVIGGCGRSGTTLLRRIIDTHPDLCCGPESSLLSRIQPDLARLSVGFGIPEAEVAGIWERRTSRAEFADHFMAVYATGRGARRWAEKTPLNITRLPWIWYHFPKAQVVHVIRDGRDVVCSLRQYPERRLIDGAWAPVARAATLAELIGRWQRDVRAGMANRGDPRYHEIRYEDLVSDPRPTLEALFAFLGEPFDERVMAYQTDVDRTREWFGDDTVSKAAVSDDGRGSIHGQSMGRWRADLGPDDRRTFADVAGPLLIELGYERDSGWLD